MTWDGERRRSSDNMENMSDHDKLIKLIEGMSYLIQQLSEHKKDFSEHKLEDKGNFAFLNRVVWGGLGAIGFLDVWLRIVGK